jgi:hypothetical protein
MHACFNLHMHPERAKYFGELCVNDDTENLIVCSLLGTGKHNATYGSQRHTYVLHAVI